MSREEFIPIRFVSTDVQCSFCWEPIAKGSPGSSSGTRGTRAFWCRETRRWLCLGCHAENTRAILAEDAERAAVERIVEAACG